MAQNNTGVRNSVYVHRMLTVMALMMTISLLPLLEISSAYAMGPGPNSCVNLYDSKIIYMKIDVGNKHYYPLKTKKLVFDAPVGKGYNATVIYQSIHKNGAANRQSGQIWQGTDAYGYHGNACLGPVRGGSTILMYYKELGGASMHGKNTYSWYKWNNGEASEVSYTVNWVQ